MRRELLQYYPHISEEAVHIVGTPQFETYADPKMLWSRDEFFTRIGGDQTRPLICYSGGDAGTCPEDPDHVAILMQLIRDGRVGRNPQVLVRPVPTEAGTRYAAVRKKYPEILWGLPQWHHAGQGEWSQVFPSHDDVKMLTNLTYYADINVNLGSTMTLDFGLRDKPVVNVAFDVADPPLFGMPVYDFYYEYEHFQPVLRFGATKIARSVQQFASYVNAYLENPSLDREGRRKLVDLEIGVPIAEATEQLLRALRKVSKES